MNKNPSKLVEIYEQKSIFFAAQVHAYVEEFNWHGQTIHIETPSPLNVSQEGSLVSFVSSYRTGQYTLWTTTDPIDDLTIDQVVDIAAGMIEKNGGIITKVTKGLMDEREIVDIEGGNPSQGIWFFKGRIILTPKNAFYLETMYKNSAERHSNLISKFKIDVN